MKLTSLRLRNFRCFESADLDLNVDGLIGVVGANGAGKSTLFAAVEWALFGTQRGPGALPAHRSGTDKRHCRVELEFRYGEQHFRVTRTPATAELWLLDSDTRLADGTTATTAATTVTLGASRDSFLSTYYARQREVQALDARGDASRRRAQLERLLGLERLRHALDLARTQVREQDILIQALAEHAADPDEALARLRDAEDIARQRAPSVVAARATLMGTQNRRSEARAAAEELQQRATLAKQAEGAARTAQVEARALRAEADRAAEALAEAHHARLRLSELAPIAQRLEELRARDREFEMRRTAAEAAALTRARWQQAQARAVELEERLSGWPDERAELLHAVEALTEAIETRQRTTMRFVDCSAQERAAEDVRRAIDVHLATAIRAQELLALAEDRTAAEREAIDAAAQLTDLEAGVLDATRRLREEREHREAVVRDGPDAECPRCRRAYGMQFQSIVEGFTAELATLERRERELAAAIEGARPRRTAADRRLARAVAAATELEALGDAGDPDVLRVQLHEAAEKHAALAAERSALEMAREQAESQIASLERRREELSPRVEARDALESEHSTTRREAELLATELGARRVDDYRPADHVKLREALDQAESARDEVSVLLRASDQIELLQARAERARPQAESAEAEQLRLEAEAQALHVSTDDVEAAKTRDLDAEQALIAATRSLHEAEKEAIRQDEAVQQARGEVAKARDEARRLQGHRRELRMRQRVHELLDEYRSDTSRRAVPTLEHDTAALLGAVTRGRYTDVRLSDSSYALELLDAGEPHTLRRFSGGEQDIANLCLRLALSRALARSQGTDSGFVILDEVLGSQDPERRAALLGELRGLTREFDQVFLVSHFEDIAEGCDIVLKVSRPDPSGPAQVTRG